MANSGLDSTELAIVRILQDDGRIATAEMARRLNVSEPTVRRKLSRLQDSEVLHVVAVTDPASLGYGAPAYIGLDVDRPKIQEVAVLLAEYDVVSSVVVATGPYDVIIEAAFPTIQDLYEFVLDELAKYEGIRDSHSFLVLQRFKMAGVKTFLDQDG